jgi:hypothetical protein
MVDEHSRYGLIGNRFQSEVLRRFLAFDLAHGLGRRTRFDGTAVLQEIVHNLHVSLQLGSRPAFVEIDDFTRHELISPVTVVVCSLVHMDQGARDS